MAVGTPTLIGTPGNDDTDSASSVASTGHSITSGLTWSQIATEVDPGTNNRVTAFSAVDGSTVLIAAVQNDLGSGTPTTPTVSNTASTVTADFSSTTQRCMRIEVYSVSGVDTTTPIGSSTTLSQGGGSSNAPELTLSGAAASSRLMMVLSKNNSDAVTPGTDVTELSDVAIDSSPTRHFWSGYNDTLGDTTIGCSWSSGVRQTIVAFELSEAAGGTAHALSGSSAGTSTVAGQIGRSLASLSASSAGSTTVAGQIVRRRELAGESAGTSTVADGSLAIAAALSGSSAGSTTVAGTLAATSDDALSGSSAGSTTVTGSLGLAIPLSGSSAGTSTVAGQIARAVALSGSAAGASTVDANLTKTGTRALSGSSAGSTAIAAAISRVTALSGSSAGASTASGRLGLAFALDVTIAGVDRRDLIEHATFRISNETYGGVATATLVLLDEDEDVTVATEDIVRVVAADGTELFEGPARAIKKLPLTGKATGRKHAITCQDYSSLLSDDVVTSGVRKTAEADDARISWLVSTFGTKGVTVGAEVVELVASMPEQDFTGMTLYDALAEIARVTGGVFYVDFDKALHYFDPAVGESTAAAFGLSDSPNDSTTFGYSGFALDEDSVDVKDVVYVVGDGVAGWYPSAPGASDRAGVLTDTSIGSQTTLEAAGAAYLAAHSTKTRGRLTTYKAGLRAGMTVQITNAAWSLAAVTYQVQRVEARMLSNDDLVYDVDFGDVPLTLARLIADQKQETRQASYVAEEVARELVDLSAAGANLVENSSFENSDSSFWTIGSNWTFGYTPGSSDAFDREKVARAALAGATAADLVTDPIEVARSDDYWISAWGFMRSLTSGSVTIELREYDASDALLATTVIATISAVELDWTRRTLRMGPNDQTGRTAFHASTTKIRVAAYSSASATLTFDLDGVQVERGRLLTAYAPRPAELVDESVGTTKITDDAITSPKIAANAVVAGKVAADTIGTNELQANAITAAKVAAGAIETSHFSATAKVPEVENSDSSVTITPSGIAIVNGKLTLEDLAGSTVLRAAGFAGAWQSFIAGGIYNGDFASGDTTAETSATITSGADSVADYEASLSTHIASWIVEQAGSVQRIVSGGATYVRLTGGAKIMQDIPIVPGERYTLVGLQKSGTISAIDVSTRDATHAVVDSGGTYAPSLTASGSWKAFAVDIDAILGSSAPSPGASFLRVSIDTSGTTEITGLRLIARPRLTSGITELSRYETMKSTSVVSIGASDVEYDSDFRVTFPGVPDMRGMTAVLDVWLDVSNTWGAATSEYNLSIYAVAGATPVNGARISFTRNNGPGGEWIHTHSRGQALVTAESSVTFGMYVRRPAGASNFTGYGHASAEYVSRIGWNLVGFI